MSWTLENSILLNMTFYFSNGSFGLNIYQELDTDAKGLDRFVQTTGDYLIFVVSTPLSMFGCFANVVNLTVFLKQGRNDCVTICLFALGFSDFLCCFTVFLFSSLYISNVMNYFSIIEPVALDVVLSYIAAMFYDISQGVTAFISLQRCLCVAMPLRFKDMFTVRRSVVIMLWFYVATTLAYTPHFRTCGISVRLEATRNNTIPALWETSDRAESILWLNYLLHIGVDTIYQLVVVVSAIVMIRGLQKSAKFQSTKSTLATTDFGSVHDNCLKLSQHTTSKNESKSSKPWQTSNKNRNVVKTIFALSLLAIVCNTERLVVVYGQRFVPGLTFDGAYQIIFFLSARVTFLFSMINASLNVLVYYFLNPSYRKTFQELFCWREQEASSAYK
ncbi:unnamed protein product [Candidula unifasciata]|uniref:G-protein coupled receptors family 1 profile domain-containing protein n=1 Tax=Candidula unifasciata TaxID=100452 RepID=A0A8S3YRW7_9EUPU|nr:unnamed protein product [Candidula unifasciata]